MMDSAYHVVNWSHVKARDSGDWARLVQFEHVSVLHLSIHGKVQLLGRAVKDQVEQEVIRSDLI